MPGKEKVYEILSASDHLANCVHSGDLRLRFSSSDGRRSLYYTAHRPISEQGAAGSSGCVCFTECPSCHRLPASVESPDCACDQPPACTAAAHSLVRPPARPLGHGEQLAVKCVCCLLLLVRSTCCRWCLCYLELLSENCRTIESISWNVQLWETAQNKSL